MSVGEEGDTILWRRDEQEGCEKERGKSVTSCQGSAALLEGYKLQWKTGGVHRGGFHRVTRGCAKMAARCGSAAY